MKIMGNNELQPKIALIISSYDGASDLWKVLERNFKKHITNYIGARKKLSLLDEMIYRFKFALIQILKKWNAL